MTANDVIEAYVTEVVLALPRRQRNDVALELRALLQEEVQGRAADTGRAADAALAVAFLNEFGRPEDVAARYRPALMVLDPADSRAFLRALVIGLAVIWSFGFLQHVVPALVSGNRVLQGLGAWWGGTVVGSLWWPGLLVVGFGLSAWTRQRWPHKSTWQPRDPDRIGGGRSALVLGLVGLALGLAVLAEPRVVLDIFWGGAAAPAAYQALTYTESFLQWQAPLLFFLLLLNAPLWLAVIAQGRWSPKLRRIETMLTLVDCAAMAWAVLGGPIFLSEASDQMAKAIMALIIALSLLYLGIERFRRIPPAPDAQMQAQR